jgi:mRNA interferase MazF
MPVKSSIHNSVNRPLGFKKRDIWYASVGENVGFEEDGKGKKFVRPVLILKVFGSQLCFVIPLSTTDKRGIFYHPFDAKTGKISVALLSQARTLDTARFHHKIGRVGSEDFAEIKKQLKELLSL